MAYITREDLEAFTSAATVLAIFDEQGDGVVDARTLGEILELASARVDGALARNYRGRLPLEQRPVPQLVRMASLLWARALAFEKHPEYVRLYGDGPRKEAEEFCETLAEAKAYLTDLREQPVPANVGGLVLAQGPRMLTDSPDGTNNGGDF